MQLTCGKIISALVNEERYLKNWEVLAFAEQNNEREFILKTMQEHRICAVYKINVNFTGHSQEPVDLNDYNFKEKSQGLGEKGEILLPGRYMDFLIKGLSEDSYELSQVIALFFYKNFYMRQRTHTLASLEEKDGETFSKQASDAAKEEKETCRKFQPLPPFHANFLNFCLLPSVSQAMKGSPKLACPPNEKGVFQTEPVLLKKITESLNFKIDHAYPKTSTCQTVLQIKKQEYYQKPASSKKRKQPSLAVNSPSKRQKQYTWVMYKNDTFQGSK